MLRNIRIIVAWVVFIAATLLVLDLTGALHLWFGWIAKVQLIPAILAVNVVALVVVVALTLLFGRIYCSTLCPLGIMQDGISWLSGRRKGKKARFRYSKPLTWLRWTMFALLVAGLALMVLTGASVVVSLLDPWATFGRIAGNLFAPLWEWGNNFFAWIAGRVDSYAFYSVDVFVRSWTVFGVAVVTLVVVAVLAWWKGRLWCNSICPVGTFLGILSRWSLFRPTFDMEKCTKCGVCEKACKSSCIDSKAQTIDRSRCVTCFDCIEACKFDAMHYRSSGMCVRPKLRKSAPDSPKTVHSAARSNESRFSLRLRNDFHKVGRPAQPSGIDRRTFLSIAALFAVTNTVKAQQLQVDGGLADIEDKKRPGRKTPIAPPGAKGIHHLGQHCTACQLCVAACPNDVLRPSSRLATLMQPEMTYERGYCRPECVECSEVCPAGAIEKITPADKTAISIGNAVWIADNCVVNRDNLPCTECERHCPTKAITLVAKDPDDPRSLKIPTIDNTKCIGCGACENLCPARPFSAIYVEGNVSHHQL